MTWEQKYETGRLYQLDKWEWNPKTSEYDARTVRDELTLKEATKMLEAVMINDACTQADIIRDDEDTNTKIACKYMYEDEIYTDWL